ncbi:MAG: hypothetical protein U0U69_08200 [Acidimicrobiia bacterium]
MRRFFVGLLVFVATLSLVLAVMTNFLRRQLLDTQTFVTTTTEIAQSPAVKSEVNKEVTDAVFAQPAVQDAIDQAVTLLPAPLHQFQSSISGAAQQGVSALIGFVLDSQAFQKVLSEALTVMHQKLISGSGLSFNVGDAKSLTGLDQAGGVVGKAASLIPDNIAGVTLLDDQQTRQLNTAIKILEKAWIWFALLSLVTTAGAIALSRQRRKTIRTWGLVLVIISLVVLAIPAFLQGPLLASLPDNVRPIVQEVWDVYIPRLDARLWLSFSVGLVVFVIAAVWGRLGLVESLRKAWTSTTDKLHELRLAHAEHAEAAAAAGGEVEKVGFRERTKIFVETLDIPGRLGQVATHVEPNIRTYRGAGVAIAALLLLLWPGTATLGVFFVIVALLILYLGGLELILGIARKPAEGEIVEPAALTPAAAGGGAPSLGAPRTSESATALVVPSEPAPEEPKLDLPYAERVSLLKELGELKAAGVLDDDEFAHEKERVLSL